jgi:hypothetical protein
MKRKLLLLTGAFLLIGNSLNAQCTQAIPYTTDYTTFLPSCWEEADNGNLMTGPTGSGIGSWSSDAVSAARINLYTVGFSDWLLSPVFDLSGPGPSTELSIEFSAYDFGGSPGTFNGMGSDDSVQVAISTDGGATWSEIYSFNSSNQLPAAITSIDIDLSSYTGTNNRFGIRGTDGLVNDAQDYWVNVHSFTIDYNCPLISAGITSQNVSCNGAFDGMATAMPTGGLAPYTFLWSNGQTTASASSLVPSTYTIFITDDNGCTIDSTITITEPTILNAGSTLNWNNFCFGDASGSATIGASGGTAPYSYSWPNGDVTATSTTLTADVHSVNILDANNCATSVDVTITEPDSLEASAALDSDVSCFGLNDGGAIASAAGGTPPYTFLWSNAEITASIVDLVAGTYTVTITDGNGCVGTDMQVVNEPTAIALSSIVTNDDGTGNGEIDLTVSGGTPAYTFSWDNLETSEDLMNLDDANYSVVVTDANGCVNSISIDVLSSVGLSENDALIFKAYPNPTSGLATIELKTSEETSIVIYSQDGKKMSETNFTGINFNVELPKEVGMYFLHIRQNDRLQVIRLIKE